MKKLVGLTVAAMFFLLAGFIPKEDVLQDYKEARDVAGIYLHEDFLARYAGKWQGGTEERGIRLLIDVNGQIAYEILENGEPAKAVSGGLIMIPAPIEKLKAMDADHLSDADVLEIKAEIGVLDKLRTVDELLEHWCKGPEEMRFMFAFVKSSKNFGADDFIFGIRGDDRKGLFVIQPHSGERFNLARI